MSDNLYTMTDAELSECFAVEVANNPPPNGDSEYAWDSWLDGANYSTSADAVIDVLEKWKSCDLSWFRNSDEWVIRIGEVESVTHGVKFARALCMAMVRYKRSTAK